jgi:hypothetical protein
MPGVLRCDQPDLNDSAEVTDLLEALKKEAQNSQNLRHLEVRGTYYFTLPEGGISPCAAGWYIICDHEHNPLYIGSAENLNKRLNTPDGSRDIFANPNRTSDPLRNFIKAFVNSSFLSELWVVIITEEALCFHVDADPPLSKLDRGNVEKVICLFREGIVRNE